MCSPLIPRYSTALILEYSALAVQTTAVLAQTSSIDHFKINATLYWGCHAKSAGKTPTGLQLFSLQLNRYGLIYLLTKFCIPYCKMGKSVVACFPY